MFPIWYRGVEEKVPCDYSYRARGCRASHLAMLTAFLRLALLGGFKVGLSSALPAFLRKASSCIVSPTRSLLTMQRHERPQESWAHECRAPFWVPRVNIPRAPVADLCVAFGSPWKLPRVDGLALLTQRRRCTVSLAAEAERLRAGLGRPQAPQEESV